MDVTALASRARTGRKSPVSGTSGVAVTSHPIATRIATDVLRDGGNACDAAMAACVAQTVVEPHMTTITGALSMLHYDAASKTCSAVNATMDTPGAELGTITEADLRGGRGVAVPGWWAGWEACIERHGSKPRAELAAPAIRLAREGFPIHPFLFGEMFEMQTSIGRSAEGREIYMPEGTLLTPGETLKQERAARTLETLIADGGKHFYEGDFGKRFCDVVQKAGGVITLEDLEAFEVRHQEPVAGTYRGYDVVVQTPPDFGTNLLEILNLLEQFDLRAMGHPTESAESLYWMMLICEAVKREGALQHDPATHPLPLDVILSKDYARMRLQLLRMAAPTAAAPPGTCHVTVLDADGNIATVKHSCMALPWQNGLFVDGVSICAAGGHFTRTMPKPRSRASIYAATNICFKDGAPVLASGSPGVGLIACVVQNTVNILDFGIDVEASVHLPRFGSSYLAGQMIEADIDERLRKDVEARGIVTEVVSPWCFHNGSFEGIAIDPTTRVASACADPRRAGGAEAI